MTTVGQTARASLFCFLSLFFALGCSTATPKLGPLVGPRVRSEVAHLAGSLISDADAREFDALNPETFWGVRLTVFALEKLPETALKPAAPEIEFIALERGDEPIASRPHLSVRSRLGSTEDPDALIAALESGAYGRSASVAELVGLLPPGVTSVFRFIEEGGKMGELRLARAVVAEQGGQAADVPSDMFRIALVLEGMVATEELDLGDEESELRRTPQPILQRELVVLRSRALAKGAVALFVPSPFETSSAAALAIVIQVQRATDWSDESRKLFAAAVTDWPPKRDGRDGRDGAGLGPRRSNGVSPGDSVWPGLAVGLDELKIPSRRRRSLVYLAHSAEAGLAEDLALSVPTPFVARFARAVELGVVEQNPNDKSAVAWLLTRSAYELLVKNLSEGGGVTVDIEGLLVLHAGEVGRNGYLLGEILASSKSMDEFEARLVRENRMYLEDISPASRSRAFFWLEDRGLAPEGYDPLATIKDRRTALTIAAESAESVESKEDASP